MGMNPMSPKRPPAPAAFKLLAELNEFMAHPLDERQAAYDDYSRAAEERQAALETIEHDIEASTLDRAAAEKMLYKASETANATLSSGHDEARGIVAAANSQAESVNETARKNVAAATAKVEAAEAEARTRTAGLAEREAKSQEREEAVKERENAAHVAALDAAVVKAQYETLILDIRGIQRRAPK